MTSRNPISNFFRAVRCDLAAAPGECLAYFLSISAFLWSLQSALQKNILPNDAVESVCWGSKLQLGYFKHPPLSAWISYWIAVLTDYSDFFQYLLDAAFTAIGVWFVYKLAREFFDEKRAGLSALVLLFVHYYTPPLLVFCPNSIQLAFQPIMAFLFYRAIRNNQLHVWLLFGLFSGLAFLGKYSAGILLACMAAGMIFHPQARKRFLSVGPYLAGLVFCIIAVPHLYWLYKHDFICLTYIGDSVSSNVAESPLVYGLFILFTGLYPILLELGVLLVACLPRHFRRCPIPADRNALYWALFLSVPPVVLYVILAMCGESVVAMWLATVASWTGIIAVCLFPFRLTNCTFRRLFLLLCLVSIVLFTATGIDLAMRTRDRIHMKPQVLFEPVEQYLKAVYGVTVTPANLIGTRGLVNVYEFYHPAHPASFDAKDPVLPRENQKKFDAQGVLIMTRFWDEAEQLAERIRPGSKTLIRSRQMVIGEMDFACRAPCGKEKTYPFYLLYLPPVEQAGHGSGK